MVAPIYNAEGRRPVYLPAGEWIDFHTHEVIHGPSVRSLHVPLEVTPLYVRANALIPMTDPVEHVPDGPFSFVTFDAYLLPSGAGTFTLRDEDGTNEVTAALVDSRLDVRFTGAKEKAGLRVFRLGAAPEITAVTVNGRPLPRLAKADLGAGSPRGWTNAGDAAVALISA